MPSKVRYDFLVEAPGRSDVDLVGLENVQMWRRAKGSLAKILHSL